MNITIMRCNKKYVYSNNIIIKSTTSWNSSIQVHVQILNFPMGSQNLNLSLFPSTK